MSSIREIIVDKWASLSHKMPMSDRLSDRAVSAVGGWVPNNWTGEEHRRRLTAYMILAAYDQNVSRAFLATTDEKDREERREYGEAGLIIDQILAHLLGESQEVTVPGADAYDAELDQPPAAGVDDTRTPEEIAGNATARVLADRQEFLRTWADDVHLALRMGDAERNAVGLGDGVYLVGWDDRKKRPVPTVMDPGFYFPVLPDTLDSYDFPETVHFAWEIPGEDFDDGKARVRRITYRLTQLRPIVDEFAAQATYDTAAAYEAAVYTLPANSRWVNFRVPGTDYVDRKLVRRYPWDTEDSDRVCTLTDATWTLDDLGNAADPSAFDLDNAVIRYDELGREVRDLDLGIDFVPVVHVPNTSPGGDHYGQSSLSRVLQLLDDIQNADTDAQGASATTGSPIISVSGSATGGEDPLTGRRGKPLEVRPGEVWRLGADGRMDVVDTSAGLSATREYVLHLLDRLAVNSRLPAAVLGRLKPSEVPSGFAMQLSFGPLTSMIRQMRLVRSVKYPLLLKMTQRLYQANGMLPEGPTPRAEIALGAYLPSDMAGTLAAVKDAYGAKIISLETAVTMLLEVGFPVDDVAEEIARIESRDFEGAGSLVDATGDADAGREYLGLPAAAEVAQPAPGVTPPPGIIVPPASAGAGAGG